MCDLVSNVSNFVVCLQKTPTEHLYKCYVPGCDKYIHSGLLKGHSQWHETARRYLCILNGCEQQFSTRSDFERHYKAHLEQVSHSRDVCIPRFKRPQELYRHMKIHTTSKKGDKTFLCKWKNCGKKFMSWENLQIHFKTHEAEMPHKCAICSWRFRDLTSFVRHMKMHSDKRFVCTWQQCKKQFTNQENLDLHINTHSRVRIYTCFVCGMKFRDLPDFYNHMKSPRCQSYVRTGHPSQTRRKAE